MSASPRWRLQDVLVIRADLAATSSSAWVSWWARPPEALSVGYSVMAAALCIAPVAATSAFCFVSFWVGWLCGVWFVLCRFVGRLSVLSLFD